MYYNQTQQLATIIEGYSDMVESQMSTGWHGYLLSFMFKPLRGNPKAVMGQMQQCVQIFYSTLITRVVRNNRSRTMQQYLPVLIGAPDLPVYKHEKQSLGSLLLNDGLHFHAIVLLPEISRLRTNLVEHVEGKHVAYVQKNMRLMHIDVEPIVESPRKVTGYALKAVKNGAVSTDDILILPKAYSELGPKQKREAPKHKPMLFSKIMSAGMHDLDYDSQTPVRPFDNGCPCSRGLLFDKCIRRCLPPRRRSPPILAACWRGRLAPGREGDSPSSATMRVRGTLLPAIMELRCSTRHDLESRTLRGSDFAVYA